MPRLTKMPAVTVDKYGHHPGEAKFMASLAGVILLTAGALAAGALPASPLVAERTTIQVAHTNLFGDLDCLRIETPSAVYLYGKRGAGFASILDPDGHDWISYRHGARALGEYRGLPKCGQPVKYFHCGYGFGQYTNSNPFNTTFRLMAPDHVRVHSETPDAAAACDWDFFPTHATMTLLKIPGRYWFLYEGTPGGRLDVADDFVVRPGARLAAHHDARSKLDARPCSNSAPSVSPSPSILLPHPAIADSGRERVGVRGLPRYQLRIR